MKLRSFFIAAGSNNEVVKIKEKRFPESILVLRDGNKLIPNLSLMRNLSRSLYEVTTEEPHNMKEGDMVTISGSVYDEVNGEHEVIMVGKVNPAVIRALIDVPSGQIVDTEILDPGSGYDESFELNVIGGGGICCSSVCECQYN